MAGSCISVGISNISGGFGLVILSVSVLCLRMVREVRDDEDTAVREATKRRSERGNGSIATAVNRFGGGFASPLINYAEIGLFVASCVGHASVHAIVAPVLWGPESCARVVPNSLGLAIAAPVLGAPEVLRVVLNDCLRPPRCVSTGPVVVRLAEKAKECERESVVLNATNL